MASHGMCLAFFSRMPWGIALALGVIFKKDGECDRSQACKPNVCSEKVFKQVIHRAGYGPHVPSKWLVFFWIMWYVYIDTMRSMSTAELQHKRTISRSQHGTTMDCVYTLPLTLLHCHPGFPMARDRYTAWQDQVSYAQQLPMPFLLRCSVVLAGSQSLVWFECTYFVLKICRLRDVENEIFIGTHSYRALRKDPFAAIFSCQLYYIWCLDVFGL